MKLFCLISCLLLAILHTSTSVDINCSYEYYTFTIIGYTYHCDIRYDPYIVSKESAVIGRALGSHENYKKDDDVTGLYASSKTIEVFPRGLENIFKNLKLIAIHYGRISEIHQADLKPFTKLQYFNLAYNDIKIIEEGLFDFNPELAYISFSTNEIHQVHPEVFSHLNKLSHLILEGNNCINRRADNSVYQVQNIIQDAVASCKYTATTVATVTSTYQWTTTTEKTTTTTEWTETTDDDFEDEEWESLYHPRDTRPKSQSVQHTISVVVVVAAEIIHILRFSI